MRIRLPCCSTRTFSKLYHSSSTYTIAAPCSSYQQRLRSLNYTTLKMADQKPHEGSTLKQQIPKQEQNLPGLQKGMEPKPFDTRLKTTTEPKEYVGAERLSGKKAFITGGEHVIPFSFKCRA
ncbi:hypothetical protein QCA50_011377 [Cerrena zonata]|uniref:Uncharacterized protein n=1 Tax=Cerrena zonata TaxID=2478898 RepID=A0AAW0G719_9APHY